MENPSDTASAYQPVREPAFTETMQIGIVVRDLEATLRRYVDDFGIGPWQVFEIGPENAPDLRHEGQPLRGTSRAAITTVGGTMWELIQPLDDEGIFARFLADKGEGVHHIAVTTPDFHDMVTAQVSQGRVLPLSGSFEGIEIAYLPTDGDLGVILEVFSGMPGDAGSPDPSPDAP